MSKFAHIVNPEALDESSDLFVAQQVSFETMKASKEYTKCKVNVELFTAQYIEDRHMVPDGFTPTSDLDRSVLEIVKSSSKRKLPLITDILNRLYEVSEADYLIYTNVDIAVMPYFYVAANNIIKCGNDAFTINQRTVSKEHNMDRSMPKYA